MLPVVRYSCLHLNLIAIEFASRTDTARSGLPVDWLREASRGYPNFRRNWRSVSFMTINCRRADTGTRISPRRQLKCIQITYILPRNRWHVWYLQYKHTYVRT